MWSWPARSAKIPWTPRRPWNWWAWGSAPPISRPSGAIARALAKNPAILLCDEPTGALDYKTGKAILALLYDLCKKSGKTVIVVTHNGALAPTADVLIRMKSGRIESYEENPAPVPVQELEW